MDTSIHLHSKSEHYNIVAGPSRDRLLDAFKYARDNTSNVPISFVSVLRKITDTQVVQMHAEKFRISCIEHDDGSGNSFNLKGTCYASFVEPTLSSIKPKTNPYKFVAYYNTATRKGVIKFDD